MSDVIAEIGNSHIPDEIKKAPDRSSGKEYTPKEVTVAFGIAFRLFQKEISDLRANNQAIPKEGLWIQNALQSAVDKTDLPAGKDTFEVKFENHHNGQQFSQQEGIPVDGLITFLHNKALQLPANDPNRQRYVDLAVTLWKNSRSYIEIPGRMNPNQLVNRTQYQYDDDLEARVHHEAYLVAQDERAKGSMDENWFQAESELINRRELVLPTSAPEPIVPPLAAPIEEVIPTPAEESTPEENLSDSEAPTPAPSTPEPVVATPITETPPPTPTNTPTVPANTQDETPEEVFYEFGIVNRTLDLHQKAREMSTQQLNDEMGKDHVLKFWHWPKKIGLRVAEEWYRQRFIKRATGAMKENNNTYLSMNVFGKKAAQQDIQGNYKQSEEYQAGQEKVDQIKSGQRIEGEKIEQIEGDLKAEIVKNILKPIIEGNITSQNQIQEALRTFVDKNQGDQQVKDIFGKDATDYKVLAEYFASDLLEMGNKVKADLAAQQKTLEQIDHLIKIKIANTRWGAESQAHFNNVDKFISLTQGNPISGAIFNPLAIAAIASAGGFITGRLLGATAKSATVFAPGVGLLAGAAFAAARRNKDLQQDMSTQRSDMAYNIQPAPNAKRREKLNEYSYDTSKASDLLNRLNATGNNPNDVMKAIAEIQTRLDFSAIHKVDLVTFDAKEQVEQNRRQLLKSIVEARKKLTDAGINTINFNGENVTLDRAQELFSGEWKSKFMDNKTKQDKEFASYRVKQSLKAFGFAAIAGLTGQQLLTMGSRLIGFNTGPTVIEGASNWALGTKFGEQVNNPIGTSINKNLIQDLYNKPRTEDLGNGLKLAINGQDHSASVLDTSGNRISPTMRITKDGSFIVSGDESNLSADLKNILGPKETQPTSDNFNIENHIKNIVNTQGKSEIFQHGNVTINIDAGAAGQDRVTSIELDGGTRIHGITKPDGMLQFDKSLPGNAAITDAEWDKLMSSIQKDGWNTSYENTKAVILGPDGEWLKHSTNLDHREWYSYDQPGSQGNELRLYTQKSGTAVILDMNGMTQAFQKGLDPNPINVQQVIQNHQAGWYFSLPNSPQEGIWVNDGADGAWDGKLRLDPNDTDPSHLINTSKGPMQLGEFSKIVVNQSALQGLNDGDIATEVHSRQNVFNLGQDGKYGFIESGRMITDKPEGNVLQAFATIRGTSPISTEIGRQVLVFDPPQAFEYKPITETPNISDLPSSMPTTPFAPRYPLEKNRGDNTPDQPTPDQQPDLNSRQPDVNRSTVPIFTPEQQQQREQVAQALIPLRQRLNELASQNPSPERNQEMTNILNQLIQIENSLALAPNQEIPINQIMERAIGPVNQNHPYFIENPESLEINLNTNRRAYIIQQIPTTAPFFVNNDGFAGANNAITPWQDFENDQRYQTAETLTNGDSGLLALAAVSAPTPEAQAQLYRTMAELILSMHQRNPQHLNNWINGQNTMLTGTTRTSLEYFDDYDRANLLNGSIDLKPENERLLTYDQDQIRDLSRLQEVWTGRIQELNTALAQGALQKHHLRWIEFLSHSSDLRKLMDLLKKSQTITAPQIQNNTSQGTTNPTVDSIQPAIVQEIRENTNFQPNVVNQQLVTFRQDNDGIQPLYSGQEWGGKIPGNIQELDLNGQRVRLIVHRDDTRVENAEYNPTYDAFVINGNFAELYQSNPELVKQTLLHEDSHREYSSLPDDQQRRLNDLFLNDPGIKQIFLQFATALYTDKLPSGEKPGENYLKAHSTDQKDHLIVSNQQQGIKDKRSIVININGEQKEVLIGPLVTEFLAYMSPLQISRSAFDTTANVDRTRRGGIDPRYDLALAGHTYIQSNPTIKSTIDNARLFRNNNEQFYNSIIGAIPDTLKPSPISVQTISETLRTYNTTGKLPDEIFSEQEGTNIFNSAVIRGTTFRGVPLDRDTLQREGLSPFKKVKLSDNVNAYLSKPYDIWDKRIAVVAYIQKGNEVVARTFYRSNSQGVWRYLPTYTMSGNQIDHFDKGWGEESVTIPSELQIALAQLSNNTQILKPANHELIFAGTSREKNYTGTFFQDTARTPVKLEGQFYQANSNAKVPPEQIKFINPQQAPNFSRPITSWTQNTDLYGQVTVETYPSQNGEFRYLFCQDGQGRVWIGGIESTKGEIQTTGVSNLWVNGGDLTTPPYEYKTGNTDQTGGYGNAAKRNGPYVDMFDNYLSKVPVIREYLASKQNLSRRNP